MIIRMRNILCVTGLFLLTLVPLFAQINRFPVEVNFSAFGSAPATLEGIRNLDLNLGLRLIDPVEASRDVRLRFTLRGNGISISTDIEALTPPITLFQNEFLFLNTLDLEPFFQFGTSPGFDPNVGYPLEEGLYELCVEVRDFVRFDESAISDVVCAVVFLDAQLAVELHTPQDGSIIPASDGVNFIPFSWTSSHTQTTIPVDYELMLFELKEEIPLDPNLLIQTTPAFSIRVDQSFENIINVQYDANGSDGELLLQNGMRYLAIVQVTDPSGTLIFRNNGFSNYSIFQYGGETINCGEILFNESIRDEALENAIQLSWIAGENVEGPFEITYYPEENPGASLQRTAIDNSSIRLENLEYDIPYLVVIGGVCDEGEITSDPIPFQLSSPAFDFEFDCGQTIEEIAITDFSPSPNSILVGDQISMSDYVVELISVSGGADNLSGAGKVAVNLPFGLKSSLLAEFDGLKVNAENQVYEGEIKVIGIQANILPPEFEDLFAVLGDYLTQEIEDKEQTLANINEILEYLQQVKEELAYFLPPSVREKLDEAIDAVSTAQTAVEEAETEEELAAAQAQLAAAKAAYDDALEAYNTALNNLLDNVQRLIKELMQEIDEELQDRLDGKTDSEFANLECLASIGQVDLLELQRERVLAYREDPNIFLEDIRDNEALQDQIRRLAALYEEGKTFKEVGGGPPYVGDVYTRYRVLFFEQFNALIYSSTCQLEDVLLKEIVRVDTRQNLFCLSTAELSELSLSNTFYAPDGSIVKIPDDATPKYFYKSDVSKAKSGSLHTFSYQEKQYGPYAYKNGAFYKYAPSGISISKDLISYEEVVEYTSGIDASNINYNEEAQTVSVNSKIITIDNDCANSSVVFNYTNREIDKEKYRIALFWSQRNK